MVPSSRGRSAYRSIAEKEARQLFTSLTAAHDSLWNTAHSPFGGTLFFKNVTTAADVSRMKQLYGRYWSPLFSR